MPFLKQDETLLVDIARRDSAGFELLTVGRNRKQERVFEQRQSP